MSVEDRLNLILKRIGATRIEGRHLKWRLPGGKIFVVARTPSDRRAWMNALHTLRTLLGGRPKHREGSRKERKASVEQSKKSGLSATEAKAGRTLRGELLASMMGDFEAYVDNMSPEDFEKEKR